MIEIGRMVIKIAGRDAGKRAVIVDIIDDNYVLIDGNVRRKRCNIQHLELLDEKIKIRKGASHEHVSAEFKKLKISVWEKKTKEKKVKPRKIRTKRKKAIQAAIEAKGKKKKKVKKEKAEKKEEIKKVEEKK